MFFGYNFKIALLIYFKSFGLYAIDLFKAARRREGANSGSDSIQQSLLFQFS